MNVSQFIGALVVDHLKEVFATDAIDGTSRFALNLSPEHSVAAAKAVIADSYLNDRVDVRLPVKVFAEYGLPDEVLTDQPATFFRNAECAKEGFLLAEVGYEETASFNEIARIGGAELLDNMSLWVRLAGRDVEMGEDEPAWWEKCLVGLRDLRFVSLDRFASYVLRTRELRISEGEPFFKALGKALPVLRLPSDPHAFDNIKPEKLKQKSAWQAQFQAMRKTRAGSLLKHTPQQLVLSEEDLSSAFEKVRGSIPEQYHPTVEAFVVAPSGWNEQAAALASVDWEHTRPLFNGLKKEKFDLGKATLDFYDDREKGLLSDEDAAYLETLVERKPTDASPAEIAFYEAHRLELKEDRKLKSAWDKLVHGKPVESTDFLAGLAEVLKALFDRSTVNGESKLTVKCERATKHDFKNLNVDAGLFFAHRYAGFREAFDRRVEWDVGELFQFPKLVEEWKAKSSGKGKSLLNRSTAKIAYQLKFTFELEKQGGAETNSAQLVWTYDPKAVTSQLYEDWSRIAANPFTACRSVRETSIAKTNGKTIDLYDVATFTPAYDRDRGSFVPVYKKERDIAIEWRQNLTTCRDRAHLDKNTADAIQGKFDSFMKAYSAALAEFPEKGAGNERNLEQLWAFEDLLSVLVEKAKGDRNRELLLKPIMRIGIAPVSGGTPAAVCLPWHPLKLGAMWRKTRLVADLVERLISEVETHFGDTRLFFKDLATDLAHPLYPEVVVSWSDTSPELLVINDVVHDYSLHEPPVTSFDDPDVTSDNPNEGAACVQDLVNRYLALNPHERANTSVVLYNCDSARLPQAVIERVGRMQSDDEDFRCQVLLRHVDGERLREVYTSVLDTDLGADAYNPSEATRDFMARLRISVIADQAPVPDSRDGCPFDIVFSQDVISRHARLEWFAEKAEPADFRTLLPSRWSRRRPAAEDDLKSAVYLCCPVQSSVGWAFLDAVATSVRGDSDRDDGRRMIPARQLSFSDRDTSGIFEETHNLGNWVVNFDELLDRRQLINQNVRVIRYKQTATQGRNLIISSSAPLGLLRSMIRQRLSRLALDLSGEEISELAERLIADANDVSGDIVLRAAKSGRSASELIGVVLSRVLVRDRLGADALAGWYFLDDYAAWMGQKEQQLADLLAISPRFSDDGAMRISMVVSEAKYVELDSLAAKKQESQKQLRDTLGRFQDALFRNPARLDRPSWLARLADLMLDGIRVPAASGFDMAEWRRAMRDGRCEIELEGISHVFVPTDHEGSDVTEALEVPLAENAYQEVFGRAALTKLLLDYWNSRNTTDTVRALGFDHLDRSREWQKTNAERYASGTDAAEDAAAEDEETAKASEKGDGQSTEDRTSSQETSDAANSNGSVLDFRSTGCMTSDETEADREWLKKIAIEARSALQQLNMQAKVLDSRLTPNSALVTFMGSANLRVDQVLKKQTELLTTFRLKVLAVLPGSGSITLVIARPERKPVAGSTLWNVWNPKPGQEANNELLVGVKESDGSPLFLSPGGRHAPHTLIAGSTGSGKSVLMQNIILGIAATNTPQQVKIVLIDPKHGVDYFAFDHLPHIEGGIIVDQETSIARLTELVALMDERYALFREERVSNLASYNSKVEASKRKPAIWVVHDEFAEWMLTPEYKEAVASVVSRLGVKARAAGIYLVFAAQRPDANVMIPQLRANLGNRLILRVDSEGTSEISLGEKGADRLLGKGHMLAKLEGDMDLCFAQVPFLDPGFVDDTVRRMSEAYQHHLQRAAG